MKKFFLSMAIIASMIFASLPLNNSLAICNASEVDVSINSSLSSSTSKTVSQLTAVGSLNGIDYNYAKTYITTGELELPLFSAAKELTQNQKNAFNSSLNNGTRVPLSPPTSKYNCHSYAWYNTSFNNQYWLDDISLLLNDSTCTQIASSSVAVNDIIVYFSASNFPVHSGVVQSIQNGVIKIKSKFGQGGAYMHSVSDVPDEYKKNGTTVSVKYYRYHYYVGNYNGNEYHSGNYHYFQFVDVCNLCGLRKNTTYYKKRACSGPPCVIPYSLAYTE